MKEPDRDYSFVRRNQEIREGYKAKTARPMKSVRVRPITSESTPAGILKKMPVTVEIATAKPMASGPTPNDSGKKGQYWSPCQSIGCTSEKAHSTKAAESEAQAAVGLDVVDGMRESVRGSVHSLLRVVSAIIYVGNIRKGRQGWRCLVQAGSRPVCEQRPVPP